MLKPVVIKIADIYVPTERRKTLDPEKAEALAEQIMEEGLENPVHVRKGKGRYVLTKGVHRLEACKSLGDTTIPALIVGAKQF